MYLVLAFCIIASRVYGACECVVSLVFSEWLGLFWFKTFKNVGVSLRFCWSCSSGVLCSVCHWSHDVDCRAEPPVPVLRMTRVCIRCITLTNASFLLLPCATLICWTSGRVLSWCMSQFVDEFTCPLMLMTRTCTRDSFGCDLRTCCCTHCELLLCYLRMSSPMHIWIVSYAF